MTFEETVAHMTSDVDSLKSIYAGLVSERTTLLSKITALKKRIAELEAGTPTEPPPVEPPTTPTGNAPKILNERFPNGVDWNLYYSNGETSSTSTNIESPRERFTKT